MTDREVITDYRNIVHEIHGLKERLAWNQRHGLPVLNILEKIGQLMNALIRFEDLLDGIPDRRARNVISCRYALGLNVRETSDIIGVSCLTVERICGKTLTMLE